MYGRNRHFRFQWLRNHSWLAYSPSEDGGYCIPCVLFATDKTNLGQLVNTPLTNFARAATTLSEHAKQSTHLKSVTAMAEAELRFRHSAPSIVQQLSSQTSQILSQNREKLTSIIKTVVFCAKQNISLRGHRSESGWSVSGGENSVGNPGNFLALLRFRAESGDTALLNHFSGSQRVNYQSPRIQNEILECIGHWMREKILREVREQPFFSICADEAADCSNKEQMPLVIRFVDKDCNIREEFMDFILCDEGTTGRAIADKIILK